MSKDRPEQPSDLETIVLQQGEQLSRQGEQLAEATATIKALQALLGERLEAKMEPQKYQDYAREQAAKSDEFMRQHAEFLAAQERAAQAGEFKFMICVFARSEDQNQFMTIGPHDKPWECKVAPAHPWALIGVDATDFETAKLKAVDKYLKVQGMRKLVDGSVPTMFQVTAQRTLVDPERDAAAFHRQIMEQKSSLDQAAYLPSDALLRNLQFAS